MGNNTYSHYFAITVSPKKSPDYTIETLHDFVTLYVAYVDHINYAYCIELGKNGDHPHFHMLIRFAEERRADKVKDQLVRFAVKHLPHKKTPNLVRVKRAHNAHMWLTEYMAKENLFLYNSGFDVALLKKLNADDNEHLRIALLGSRGYKVTRANFLPLFHEFVASGQLESMPGLGSDTIDQYYTDVVSYFYHKEFQVHFFFYNKKQILNMMEFACDIAITLDL